MFGWGKHTEVREIVDGEAVFLDDEGMEPVVWDGGIATVCAWCLAEQGIAPDPADSHGICASHSAAVLYTYRERKGR